MKEKKTIYESPELTVLKLDVARLVCDSGHIDDYNHIDPWTA